jgi:hypothetical protein
MMGRTTRKDVDAFIDALDHPLLPLIRALRTLLLALDPAISDEIKWNAPSFRTTGHFATMQLRRPDAVRLVLHLGARPRSLPAAAIADPDGLLTWLGPDRALLEFRAVAELDSRRAAVTALLRQWVAQLA